MQIERPYNYILKWILSIKITSKYMIFLDMSFIKFYNAAYDVT